MSCKFSFHFNLFLDQSQDFSAVRAFTLILIYISEYIALLEGGGRRRSKALRRHIMMEKGREKGRRNFLRLLFIFFLAFCSLTFPLFISGDLYQTLCK